jgi:hypothetical protein
MSRLAVFALPAQRPCAVADSRGFEFGKCFGHGQGFIPTLRPLQRLGVLQRFPDQVVAVVSKIGSMRADRIASAKTRRPVG